jgi:flagellar basal body-associated protein FliL
VASHPSSPTPPAPAITQSRARLLIIICIALFVAAASLLYFTFGPSRAPVLEPEFRTPAWQTADQLNAKLHENPEFTPAAFVVASESPLRFKLNGAVESTELLEKIRARAKEIRPEEDYDFEVLIMSGG